LFFFLQSTKKCTTSFYVFFMKRDGERRRKRKKIFFGGITHFLFLTYSSTSCFIFRFLLTLSTSHSFSLILSPVFPSLHPRAHVHTRTHTQTHTHTQTWDSLSLSLERTPAVICAYMIHCTSLN